MNVSGKSLQDIYDAGSKRLDELDSTQTTALKDTTESHLDERSRVEPESLKRLEERTEELEKEVRACLDRGLERVERAVANEGQESERHISRLVEGLVLLSKKFSESIGQLREAAESELTDLSDDSHHEFRANAESITIRLREESTSSLDSSRLSGAQSESAIADTVESNWREIYDTESDAIAGFSDAFLENADSIGETSLDSKKNLEESIDHKLLILEGRLSQAGDNTRAVVDKVAEHAERYTFDADVRLKERFSSSLYEMSTSFDESATRAASDMAGLHESSMADLTMKSQELSREMDSLAEEVTTAASSKSEQLQGAGNEMLNYYTHELNRRLDQSNVFLTEIEAERAQNVAEIWQELTGVKSRFEEKLKQLAHSTLDKMRVICEEAETAVVGAQQSCLNDSKTHATAKRDLIENDSRQFIERVESTRQAALEGIIKAAGATSETAVETPVLTALDDASKNEERNAGLDESDAETEERSRTTNDDEADEESGRDPNLSDGNTSMESRKRRERKAAKASDKRSPGDSKK